MCSQGCCCPGSVLRQAAVPKGEWCAWQIGWRARPCGHCADQHPAFLCGLQGSFDIVHVKDAVGHTFATRMTNVFVIGKGDKPLVSLPKGKGIRCGQAGQSAGLGLGPGRAGVTSMRLPGQSDSLCVVVACVWDLIAWFSRTWAN